MSFGKMLFGKICCASEMSNNKLKVHNFCRQTDASDIWENVILEKVVAPVNYLVVNV